MKAAYYTLLQSHAFLYCRMSKKLSPRAAGFCFPPISMSIHYPPATFPPALNRGTSGFRDSSVKANAETTAATIIPSARKLIQRASAPIHAAVIYRHFIARSLFACRAAAVEQRFRISTKSPNDVNQSPRSSRDNLETGTRHPLVEINFTRSRRAPRAAQ